MAKIRMNYMFIRKKKIETEKTLKEIILDVIANAEMHYDSEYITGDDEEKKICYEFIEKHNERCVLELVSNNRKNVGIELLQRIDDAISSCEEQMYFHYVRDYDGISEANSIKLYPKYAAFERMLRQMVLIVLIKAMGEDWGSTISDDMLNDIKKNARNGKPQMSQLLECMDLSTIEAYLFEIRHVEYERVFVEELTQEKIESMTKEDICNSINRIRPKSLWERSFAQLGPSDEWRKEISRIRDDRNCVAHHKRITLSDYKEMNKRINRANKRLANTISRIKDTNISSLNSIDLIGSFVIKIGSIAKEIMEQYDFSELFKSMNAIVQKIALSTSEMNNLNAELVSAANQVTLRTDDFRRISESVSENLRESTNRFASASTVLSQIPSPAYSQEVLNAMQIARETQETIGKTFVCYDDDNKR